MICSTLGPYVLGQMRGRLAILKAVHKSYVDPDDQRHVQPYKSQQVLETRSVLHKAIFNRKALKILKGDVYMYVHAHKCTHNQF